MGTAYEIHCKHCGARIDHYAAARYPVVGRCVGSDDYVETELPMRCPACRHMLNTTPEEFREQVKARFVWD